MGKGKNVAIGAAIAGVAGYVAGILTAPKSGKETRKDIKDKAIQTKVEAEKQLKKLHSQLDDLLNQGKELSSKLSDSAKAEWVKLAATAVTSKDKVRAVLSSIHEGGTDDKDLQKAVSDATTAVDHLKDYLAKNVKNAKS
ncbi:MAG: YtxH domain-containing protein [Candidatus Saccharimonadales bacterium]